MDRILRTGLRAAGPRQRFALQIEHHLFPTVSRGRFHQVRAVVREFCRERGLDYRETRVLQYYREILGHLARVERALEPTTSGVTGRL